MASSGLNRYYARFAGYRGLAVFDPALAVNVLYDGIAAQLDTSGGRWQTVCEKHGAICAHQTLALARQHLGTSGWCEECQRIAAND